MMVNQKGDRPLYKQLSELLRNKIISGEWESNTKIPTEPELCSEYNLSRTTVRLALDELKNDGFIYRRQGKGTFVSQPKINQRLSSFYSFTDEIQKKGYSVQKTIISWKEEAADKALGELLNILPSASIYKIERILYRDKQPFALETSYIPVSLCPGLSQSLVERNGLYNSLEQYGIRPDKALETFEAIILNNRCQKLLKTSKTVPGFLVHRTSHCNDRPVEYCECYVNGELVRYNVELK